MTKQVAALAAVIVLLIAAAATAIMTSAQSPDGGAGTASRSFFPYLAGTDSRNGATIFTRGANAETYNQLPWDDTSDYDSAQRGFIAPLPQMPLTFADRVVWDPAKYDFVTLNSTIPDTVNPSLWRQSQLVNIAGLFQVTDRIYQVRNYDLSNITFIEGDTGLIVVDPLISVQTARAALELYFEHRPRVPVVAMIYSHSHVDHWGGSEGIISLEQAESGEVAVFAPTGFMDAAVQENVFAGTVMGRRSGYMYGDLLPADVKGSVGSGLGMEVSEGLISLIPPNFLITDDNATQVIDGLTFEFMLVPDTEAPSEMLWYLPELHALTTAEDATQMMHNVYSLRGAKVRDPLAWSEFLNEVIDRWGAEAEVHYVMHSWPVWDNDNINEYLKKQRDLYRYINDQTLRLANLGYTPLEIGEMLELPREQARTWASRGNYGTLNHNVKAAYDRYLGWFDGNPANLHPLPPVEAGQKYVELAGGADALLANARAAYSRGEYRWVAELVNHLVFADPDNEEARALQADALEQLGYQSESGPWRNFYLTGAQELRQGVNVNAGLITTSPELINVIQLDLMFDFMGIHLNGPRADGKKIVLNWIFTGDDEEFLMVVENAVVDHTAGEQSAGADATIIINRGTLVDILSGQTTIVEALQEGLVEIEGNELKVFEFFLLLDRFPSDFNIVTP